MGKESETSTSISTTEEEGNITPETYNTKARRCSCFPCFGPGPGPAQYGTTSSPSVWERLQQTSVVENKWWAGPLNGLKKAREWSEIIAGPKWKTFIRRLTKGGKNGGTKSRKFNYDPLSYSLNFDDGQGHNGHLDDDCGYNFPDFTSRLASISSSCKSSMDLGKTNEISFSD